MSNAVTIVQRGTRLRCPDWKIRAVRRSSLKGTCVVRYRSRDVVGQAVVDIADLQVWFVPDDNRVFTPNDLPNGVKIAATSGDVYYGEDKGEHGAKKSTTKEQPAE